MTFQELGRLQPNPSGPAVFSEDRVYRYTLRRRTGLWDRELVFVMLNPSTADETKDDPTVRRCIRFAHDWEFGRLVVVNIFAHRATDPTELLVQDDPVGPLNDWWIWHAAWNADMVVLAWGVYGAYRDRGYEVAFKLGLLGSIREKVHVLGLTKDGHPKHPLYIPADRLPVAYSWQSKLGGE